MRGDAIWRRTNLGHLLFAGAGRLVARKLRVVQDAGFHGVTDAQLALFQNIDSSGTRLTVLSARAGLAKPSMIELIDKAEQQGFVERSPDPTDRRAKIVKLTERGLGLSKALALGMAQAEHDLVVAVGLSKVATLKRGLIAFAPEAAGHSSIERIVSDAARRFVRNVLSEVHRHGYRNVTEALLALFRTLELEGSRLTEIAATARITKQSMRGLVERAEILGFIERAVDQMDGRAKIIRFSQSGMVMLEEMRRGVAHAEAGFATATSKEALRELKTLLSAYLAAPKAR